MRLTTAQKIEAAISFIRYKSEIKALLIRRFWQQKKQLKVTVLGTQAIFDTSDFLSNVFFWQNEFPEDYEPAVSKILATLIKSSEVYADVGGNVGFFSILPALFNPTCKIYYLEMDRTIRPVLIKNLKLNGLSEDRISIINAAVGDGDGDIEYVPHPYSFLAMLGRESTASYDLTLSAKQIVLDRYFLSEGRDPDLIKIDIDGAEMSAPRGMSRILKETKPNMLLEVHPAYLPKFGSSASEVFDFLNARSYKLFEIEDFRNTGSPKLIELRNLDHLKTPTGDMLFATTGDRNVTVTDGEIRQMSR
jgi:FkbM family methyltransferase